MTDIAKLTGVSQSTVSLVLNNATGAKFSDATRNKVLKAAQELGYRMTAREPLEAVATRDAGNEKNLIVYLADEISTSPHPVVNIDGARDAAYASGKMLAVYSTHGNADVEQQVLETTLSNPQLFGVIYATVYTRKVTPPAALSQIPTVLLNCYTGDGGFSSVVPAEVAEPVADAEATVAPIRRTWNPAPATPSTIWPPLAPSPVWSSINFSSLKQPRASSVSPIASRTP